MRCRMPRTSIGLSTGDSGLDRKTLGERGVAQRGPAGVPAVAGARRRSQFVKLYSAGMFGCGDAPSAYRHGFFIQSCSAGCAGDASQVHASGGVVPRWARYYQVGGA